MLIDLGGAVVGRDGLKAKGVAHNERGGVSWKAADVATVAEVYSPALAAMMDREGLTARRRTGEAAAGGTRFSLRLLRLVFCRCCCCCLFGHWH